MLKVMSPLDWDFDIEPTSMVKVSSRGLLGNDLHTLVKRAGHEFAHQIKSADLKPGDIPVHLIALGATEGYGCFAAGTPFALADGTYRRIENVQLGDLAVTADGNVCPVDHLFQRDVDQTVAVDVCGLPHELVCSTNHPFRVARYEQFACCHDKYKRCLPPTQGQQNICLRVQPKYRPCAVAEYPEIEFDWATADSLRVGDFLVSTAPRLPVEQSICVDEAYLMGAWLAEGCFQKNYASVRLVMHAEEVVFYATVATAAWALGLRVCQYDNRNNSTPENAQVVTLTGDPQRFRNWFSIFGEHAHRKHIPPWMCSLPADVKAALLAGYIDGDGHCAVSDKENRVTARSAGRDLAFGLQRLCWSLGIPTVICQTKVHKHWSLSIANSHLGAVQPFSWKIRPRELKQTTKVHGFSRDGRMYLPIRNLRQTGPGRVYNVEIADDHTYSGPNVDSHNCNRNGDGFTLDTCRKKHDTFVKLAKWYRGHKNSNPDNSWGYVKMSHVNEDMKRIELLTILNGTKEAAARNGGHVADEEMALIAKGEPLPVSMACKLAYDTCVHCGNKATKRADYCTEDTCSAGGCRHNLMKVGADGRIPYVDNPAAADLIWFDISKVRRPADRTAYGWAANYLQKAASGETVGGAEIAELIGAELPIAVVLADSGLNLRQTRAAAEIFKLAELEQTVDSIDVNQITGICLAEGVRRAIYVDLSQLTKSAEAVPHALYALSAESIVLPLKAFLDWQLKDVTKAAEVVDSVAAALPGVYARLSSDPQLASQLKRNDFVVSDFGSTAQRVWAAKQAADLSLAEDQTAMRAYRAAITNKAALSWNVLQKQAAYDATAVALANRYGLYTAAALAAMPDDAQLTLTRKLVVLQNHLR